MSQVRQSLLFAVIALAAVVPLLSAQEPKPPQRDLPTKPSPIDPDSLPAVFEKAVPVEAFAPTARDGHKGAGFLRKPTGKGPFPAVILLHGGFGGLPADKVEHIALGPWATRYLAAGYVVVASTYRRRAADPQSAKAVEDVIAVIEHLRKLPYIDGKSIVLNGFSGGGDLALSVAAATDLAAIVLEEPAGFMFTGVSNKQLLKEGEVYSL